MQFKLGVNKGTFLIAKHENSVASDRVYDYIIRKNQPCSVIIIIDSVSRRYSTGETSWLWDIDYGVLKADCIQHLYLLGRHAKDLETRLSYTDIDIAKVTVNEDIPAALDEIAAKPLGKLYTVTIEDTIEQIVGELEDEHDRTQHADPEQIGENKWSMPARTPIADLEEIFEIDIDEDDVDTVYGLLTKLLGRVPIVGSTAVTRGLRLTAVDSAGRRKKVSTIVVEPAHVEGVDETEQHEDHTNGAEEASHDDKDSKDKHD